MQLLDPLPLPQCRIYKVTFSITSNLSHPQHFLRWDFTQISDQNSTDISGDRCKIFVCPCGHCLSVSLTERWWMTLARTLHVFLQHSSPHKTLSTLAALGHSQEAVSLTERCWMTLSIYWGAQHNLAPVGQPQYTAVHNITSKSVLLQFAFQCNELQRQYNSSAHRKAVWGMRLCIG